MTDIDPKADIELAADNDIVVARLPLAGAVSQAWLERYQRLALATGVPARIESEQDRPVIAVSLPASGTRRQIARTMDAARGLIAEADSGSRRDPVASQAAANAREWWDRARDNALRRPIARTRVVRTGIGAESRWTLTVALALGITILLLLPSRFSFGPNWLVPAIEAGLLAGIFVTDVGRNDHWSRTVRVLSAALIVVLVAEAAFVTGRLVLDLVQGGPETNSASALLKIGFGVWIYTIIAFGFLYWLLDGGGPEVRIWDPPEFADLAFPEQLNPQVAPPGWRPTFADYLYLGFTNATAFSPTDVMPLARWAKLAMTVQATTSLAVLGLVIARAVNIFK